MGNNILFVGFGAVSYVMMQALAEIFQQQNKEYTFTILSRSRNFEEDIQGLQIPYTTIIENDFLKYFDLANPINKYDIVINTSTPDFNEAIIQRCQKINANYIDLASIIQEEQIQKTAFEQEKYTEEWGRLGKKAILNIGISPGITEILIAHIIKKYNIKTKSIKIFLDENFNSFIPLFSRSPKVAIDEVLHDAYHRENKKIITTKPFTHYAFCKDRKCFDYYRVYQEEIISIQKSLPEIENIEMFVGGSEVEQVRFLYNLGLLSNEKIGSTSLLDIVTSKLPKAAKKQEMIDAYKRGFIDDAGFKTRIVLTDITDKNYTITMDFPFSAFKKIQNTSYQGATSISYPTGLGAASILGFVYQYSKPGIQNCLQLGLQIPQKATKNIINFLKKHLIKIKIETE